MALPPASIQTYAERFSFLLSSAVPHRVTIEEIAAIQRALMHYHDGHAQQCGPMDTCDESTCREAKLAITWLIEQAVADR